MLGGFSRDIDLEHDAFTSVEDLVTRAHVVQRDLEALAESGTLVSLIAERRSAMWSSRAGSSCRAERENGPAPSERRGGEREVHCR